MRRVLSMTNLAAVLLASCVAAPSLAQLAVTPIRQAGDSLDPSIRNEADHAIDLAADWLAAKQNPDGSWGTATGRVKRTSITLLALTTRARRHSDPIARAAVWLDRRPASDNATTPDAYAWRLIALLSVSASDVARTNLAARLLRETRPFVPHTAPSPSARLLWADAFALADAAAPFDAQPAVIDSPVTELAAHWQPARQSPQDIWRAARLINRTAAGQLETKDGPLDWRRDIAQALINSQRRDPAGGAYWTASVDGDMIAATAFGILSLSEL